MIENILDFMSEKIAAHTDTPELDAQVLLAEITGKPRTWLLAHPKISLTKSQQIAVQQAISKIEDGLPLPYVLGHWEFFGLDFNISPNTLIPRPETELLVERAKTWLQAAPHRRTVADVGTGCGCIAVALAKHIPDLWVIATDISRTALKIARKNVRRHKVQDRVDLIQCDLLPPHYDPLATQNHFDLICANLPYIPSNILLDLPIFGREPSLALDGGEDGLDQIRRLLAIAPDWLAPGGAIFLEIEASQGPAMLGLAYDMFSRAHISLEKDLSGRDRLVRIQMGEL